MDILSGSVYPMKELWCKIFPQSYSCQLCDVPHRRVYFAGAQDQICMTCREHVKPIVLPGCGVCGRVERCDDSKICYDCMRVASSEWVYNRSAVEYTESIRRLVHDFKYRGNQRLAHFLGQWMSEVFFREFCTEQIDLVTYVPLSADRLCERGFNQAQILAKKIAKKCKLPLMELLTRGDSDSFQSKRGRQERLSSAQNTFVLSSDVQIDWIRKKRILIVDDVYTTGSTLRECAKPLTRMGSSRIYALTIAR